MTATSRLPSGYVRAPLAGRDDAQQASSTFPELGVLPRPAPGLEDQPHDRVIDGLRTRVGERYGRWTGLWCGRQHRRTGRLIDPSCHLIGLVPLAFLQFPLAVPALESDGTAGAPKGAHGGQRACAFNPCGVVDLHEEHSTPIVRLRDARLTHSS